MATGLEKVKPVINAVAAVVLYLSSLAIGLYDIYFGREIAYALYARFLPAENFAASFISIVVVVVLAIAWVAFAIFTGEYHLKNYGKPGSWNLFMKSFLVLLVIPFLLYFM